MSKKITLHYVVHNNSDGSASARFFGDAKSAQLASDIEDEGGEAYGDNPHRQDLEFDANGTLLNPDGTKEELTRELAEARGEDVEEEDTPARKFNKVSSRPAGAFTGKVWYVLTDGGDGSANVAFYADEETAQLKADLEVETQAFNDNGPFLLELEYDAQGQLLNPSATLQELKAELAEARGEEVEEEPAAPAATGALAGKTVVFTGTLSTMTRKQAETEATAMGADVSGSVSKNTDILVVGADAGSKLAKAKALGVTVVSENEWNKMKSQGGNITKPPAPKP